MNRLNRCNADQDMSTTLQNSRVTKDVSSKVQDLQDVIASTGYLQRKRKKNYASFQGRESIAQCKFLELSEF